MMDAGPKNEWPTSPPNSAPIRPASAARPPASGSAVVTANGAPDSNAVKLGTDREDVDLRRVGVELDFIGRPFDAVTVRPVSLDHSGTCPVSPWAEAFLGDLVDGFGECVGESVRGKSPPG